MKRQREDPMSYLGGDLVDIAEDDYRQLTKAERNSLRKANNKKWKLTDRKVSSGKDPCPRHTLYYKAQIPDLRDEEEWRAFQTALVDPLPVSFRIGGGCPAVVENTFRKRMATEFNKFSGHYVEVDGRVLTENIVKPVSWADSGSGSAGGSCTVWQVSADSATLAKNPGFQVLSGLLRREVALGNIVRQELASMIPALLLAVQSHHVVLDVCAAPGSKTEQLLHLMASQQSKTNIGSSSRLPCTGMVVANDADPVRITTLKNRYARCLTPHLLITCATAEELASRIQQPVFDRILADVPCSGDGTIRKFPHIWRLFRPRMSLDLHKVQLSIAQASVDMLKVEGGRMVYSTCSLNPLEDEAVVCALLQLNWHRGLRLVDTRGREGLLPGLRTRAGLSYWRCDPDVFLLGETDESVRRESLARLPELVTSMMPPSADDALRLHLERCHRILPQDNDTGGFFVAVLELQDCCTIDPLELEYFRDKAVSSSSGKKKKKTIKESITSVNVMKELGYNPKRKKQVAPAASMKLTKKEQTEQKMQKSTKKKDESSDGTVIHAPSYRQLSATEVERFCNGLDLHISLPPSPSLSLSSTFSSSANNKSACDKVSKEYVDIRLVAATSAQQRERTGRGEEGKKEVIVSLVSASVQQALQTWAQSSESTSSSAVGILVHAGVPVATAFCALEHEDDEEEQEEWHLQLQEYSMLADGVTSLWPWLRDNTSTTAILSSADFRALARLRGEGQRGVLGAEGGVRLARGDSAVEALLAATGAEDEGDMALLQTCVLSEGGQAALEALCASCQQLLQEEDDEAEGKGAEGGAKHMILVLDHSDQTSSLTGGGEGAGDSHVVKRRLSKMERKRLGKHKEQRQTSASALSVVRGGSCGSSCDSTNGGNCANKAIIVMQLRRGGKYRSDFLLSFLTQEDVCKSYAASIVV